MKDNVIYLVQVAKYSIDDAFEDFLNDQRQRLKPKTLRNYEEVISLLREYMNGYAYQGLSRQEEALYNQCYDAEGPQHREFCQVFGPEKILENVGMFLSYFIVRKVMAGAQFKRSAGTVIKKLSKWLGEQGHLSEEETRQAVETGGQAVRDLPSAEIAGDLLWETTQSGYPDINKVDDEDYIEFDQHTITKIEPGKIWLEVYDTGGPQTFGPISVPKKATDLLQVGWELSCSLVRYRKKWKIGEMGKIYPR